MVCGGSGVVAWHLPLHVLVDERHVGVHLLLQLGLQLGDFLRKAVHLLERAVSVLLLLAQLRLQLAPLVQTGRDTRLPPLDLVVPLLHHHLVSK